MNTHPVETQQTSTHTPATEGSLATPIVSEVEAEITDLLAGLQDLEGTEVADDATILERIKKAAKATRIKREATKEMARRAAVADMLVRIPKITGPDSLVFFSLGRMLAHPDKDGQTSQDISRAKPVVMTVWDFVDWLLKDRRGGTKFGAPCFYAGHFFEGKNTTRENCATVSVFVIDLDAKFCKKTGQLVAAIRNREELEKIRALLRSKGMFLFFTSSSHNPAGGKWCCKFILFSAVPMTYEEAHEVGKELRLELANTLGIAEEKRVKGEVHRWDCVDPVVACPVQCQLSPRWRDKSFRDQAEFCFEWEGLGVWDPTDTYPPVSG